jgi:hypothetical protein
MKFYTCILLAILMMACESEKKNDSYHKFDKVSGFVQKGPYLNGTALTISELSEDFSPTGRTFNAQIQDNKGSFEVFDIELASTYVELKADGYYFNEVANENSISQLTLFALSDISDKSDLNINILSHLEKGRVIYLIHDGKTFNEAKKQAQKEILEIFEIVKPDIAESELLDISKEGDDNAILLAVSVILQGYLSVSELSELLANISTDIREDGILNSKTLGTILINNAKNIDLDAIRTNLENRFETLGMSPTVPDFEQYVQSFIANTDFEYTGFITYPQNGTHGPNLLDTLNTISSAGSYSMKAVLPEGTSLKIKIAGSSWYFPAFQENTGWSYGDWNAIESSRIFTSTQTGEIDYEILLEYSGINVVCDSLSMQCDTTFGSSQTIIYVYENESPEPTWSRIVSLGK